MGGKPAPGEAQQLVAGNIEAETVDPPVGALQADDALLLRYRRSADPADAPPV